MLGSRPTHPLRALIILFSSLLAACAVTPPAEKRAMQSELRSEMPRVVQLADLSSKAYLTPEEEPLCPKLISVRPKIECFRVPIPHFSKGYEAVYLIETDDHAQEQVVAIRGTDNPNDLLTDLGIHKTNDPQLDVPVHSGFQRYAQTVYDDIRNNRRLNPHFNTIVTGHSLGGAAALLVGLYLYVDKSAEYQVEGVYTFGQPKVFDNRGTTSWPFFARRVFRVVDCDDVVPILPTDDSAFDSVFRIEFLDKGRREDYQHFGQSLLRMDNGYFWMPGSIELERDLSRNVKDTLIDPSAASQLIIV